MMTLYDNALIYAPNAFFIGVGFALLVAIVAGVRLGILTWQAILFYSSRSTRVRNQRKTVFMRRVDTLAKKAEKIVQAIKKEILIEEE